MPHPTSTMNVRLTREEDEVMSRVTDALRSNDQKSAKKYWLHLIELFVKSNRHLSKSEINHLLWQTLTKTHLLTDLNKPTIPESVRKEIARLEESAEYLELDLQTLRQEAETAFQKCDQKTNQLINILATILKTMSEMRGVALRGMG